MRRHSGLLLTMGTSLAVCAAASAQTQQRQHHDQDQHTRQSQQEHMQLLMLHHGDDEIVNAAVTNLHQENLGNISALVLDLQEGRVTYGIVSFGGFLGIGDELHAVPWNAFAYRPLYNGIVLDVTREQLERQEGFTRDRLPDFGDRQWGQRLHQQFGTQARDQLRQEPADPDEPTYPGMGPQQFVTTYDLIGMTVQNRQGENIGTIRDFAVDLRNGEIKHVVMGYGGWLGIGETNTALPLHSFQPRNLGTDDAVLVLDVTQDQLRGAPEYRLDRWPRQDAATWAQSIRTQAAR